MPSLVVPRQVAFKALFQLVKCRRRREDPFQGCFGLSIKRYGQTGSEKLHLPHVTKSDSVAFHTTSEIEYGSSTTVALSQPSEDLSRASKGTSFWVGADMAYS